MPIVNSIEHYRLVFVSQKAWAYMVSLTPKVVKVLGTPVVGKGGLWTLTQKTHFLKGLF